MNSNLLPKVSPSRVLILGLKNPPPFQPSKHTNSPKIVPTSTSAYPEKTLFFITPASSPTPIVLHSQELILQQRRRKLRIKSPQIGHISVVEQRSPKTSTVNNRETSQEFAPLALIVYFAVSSAINRKSADFHSRAFFVFCLFNNLWPLISPSSQLFNSLYSR
jgi:hypothetical protein